MTIKSILCIFGGLQEELNAVNTAFTIGKTCGAHIRFLHVSPIPSSYAGMYGEGIIASASIIEAIEKENDARMRQAKQQIDTLSTHYHVPLDNEESPLHHAAARFVHLTDDAKDIIAQEGWLCDLIIAGGGGANALYDNTIIAALFDTGRPVMLLPKQREKEFEQREYKTIAVAWKGGMEAARALYNAMPFLEGAEKVFVLTVEGHGEMYDLRTEALLMTYLRTHGIHAQGIVTTASERTAGEVLLAKAKEMQADLLVMGAYGHSRFREMMLGGVTTHILEKADIPLLLSH